MSVSQNYHRWIPFIALRTTQSSHPLHLELHKVAIHCTEYYTKFQSTVLRTTQSSYPLHSGLLSERRQAQEGKPWLWWTKDVIRQICELINIDTIKEYIHITSPLHEIFSNIITLDRNCMKQNLLVMDVEIKMTVYTVGSTVWYKCSAWLFKALTGGKITVLVNKPNHFKCLFISLFVTFLLLRIYF